VVHDDDEVKGGGGIWGYGGAAVDPRTGDVFVATGNALAPEPQDQPYAESVVRLDGKHLSVLASNTPSNFSGQDLDFGATPLVFRVQGCGSAEVRSGARYSLRRWFQAAACTCRRGRAPRAESSSRSELVQPRSS
jgi:hypothetical protein